MAQASLTGSCVARRQPAGHRDAAALADAVETRWTPDVHLLVLACGVAVWWSTRSGRRSARELALLDVACLVPPVAFSSVALWFAAPLVTVTARARAREST